ncbi:MAG: hypothetical protein GF317_05185 [Candidatus Lokiarchaeota archaeon]|nr:hypothetical protein [Candidatus Lokiarchaeota archaeon]MBD3199200.1 hypothetical protein [Candidatus Lokiarchaeota archaeon]
MKLSRYKKHIILFLVAYLVFTLPFIPLNFIADGGAERMTMILPFDTLILQIMAIILFIPLGALLGGFAPGYLFAPLMLFFYKKTIGFRMEFGIQERKKPDKFKGTWKGTYPALLAVNIALIIGLTTFARDFVVTPEYVGAGDMSKSLWPLVAFTSLIPFTTALSFGIFSPVWFLSDSGIVFTNKKKVKGTIDPIEVRSIGSLYHYILKGYAGIGVLISYIMFFFDIVNRYDDYSNPGFIITAILLPLIPILIALLSIPSIMLLDFFLNSRRKFMRNFAKRLGITGPLEDPLDFN